MIAKDEAEFSLKAKDWLSRVYYRQQPKLTPFLTPRQQELLEQFAKNYEGLALSFEGGAEGAERVRCMIHPLSEEPSRDEFFITGFAIDYPKKFAAIGHRQILGSLMGLQIDRSRIGDIIVEENGNAYVLVMGEMEAYIKEHFTSVGATKIKVKPVNLNGLKREHKMDEFEIMVASYRLDVIVAALLKLSRAQAAETLKGGLVQVNHQAEQNHSRICQPGDLLSIKKSGRFNILKEVRTTKNKKLVLLIGKTV